MTTGRLALFIALFLAAVTPVDAKAPSTSNVMQPIDTSAGALSDARRLLTVNMDRPVRLSMTDQPAELALGQLGTLMGVQWGFMKGVDLRKPVTIDLSGSTRDVLKGLGIALGVRFEATGPTQMRVFPARSTKPAASQQTAPPPVKHTEQP